MLEESGNAVIENISIIKPEIERGEREGGGEKEREREGEKERENPNRHIYVLSVSL